MSATLTFAPFAPGTGVAFTSGVGLAGTVSLSGVRSTSHPTPRSAMAKPDIKIIAFGLRITPPHTVILAVKIFSVYLLTRDLHTHLPGMLSIGANLYWKSAINRRFIPPTNQSIPYSEICKAHALIEKHGAVVVNMFNKRMRSVVDEIWHLLKQTLICQAF